MVVSTRGSTTYNCASKRSSKHVSWLPIHIETRRADIEQKSEIDKAEHRHSGYRRDAGGDALKISSYTIHRQRNTWRENHLADSDEQISGKFDWHLVRQFGPYL